MRIPTRCFTVYDWVEERSGSFYIDMMVDLVDEFHLQPTKIGIQVPGEKKSRNKTIFKKTSISEYLHQYDVFKWIEFSNPENGNYYRAKATLSISLSNNKKK